MVEQSTPRSLAILRFDVFFSIRVCNLQLTLKFNWVKQRAMQPPNQLI